MAKGYTVTKNAEVSLTYTVSNLLIRGTRPSNTGIPISDTTIYKMYRTAASLLLEANNIYKKQGVHISKYKNVGVVFYFERNRKKRRG